jgi:hypothetical protein
MFRFTGTLGRRPVLWLVNRSGERGSYALDELFTEKEAACFKKLLQSRDQEYRIEEVPSTLRPEQLPSWNLAGRLVELEKRETDRLAFPVVGCLEA